ncbi:hypothetical protein [Kordia jejudonensis]|uniref:hypothetical protein n=1 Tax=Kordia jejudonensis TaxID=1348245 RepID=UPI0006298256|nr:hypothetical protein [Kordia jejudonensis]
MYKKSQKEHRNGITAVANAVSQHKSNLKKGFELKDNRPHEQVIQNMAANKEKAASEIKVNNTSNVIQKKGVIQLVCGKCGSAYHGQKQCTASEEEVNAYKNQRMAKNHNGGQKTHGSSSSRPKKRQDKYDKQQKNSYSNNRNRRGGGGGAGAAV